MAKRIKITTKPNGEASSSEVAIYLTFDHPDGLTEKDVADDLHQALVDFAQQYSLDIYERGPDGSPTEVINQAKLESAIDSHFSAQFESVVTARRHELAAQAVTAASKFRRPQAQRRHG